MVDGHGAQVPANTGSVMISLAPGTSRRITIGKSCSTGGLGFEGRGAASLRKASKLCEALIRSLRNGVPSPANRALNMRPHAVIASSPFLMSRLPRNSNVTALIDRLGVV
jgi:hypothetical protein